MVFYLINFGPFLNGFEYLIASSQALDTAGFIRGGFLSIQSLFESCNADFFCDRNSFSLSCTSMESSRAENSLPLIMAENQVSVLALLLSKEALHDFDLWWRR